MNMRKQDINKIKEVREKYGTIKQNGKRKAVTQERLAKLTGYSTHHIYRLEKGKRQITPRFEVALKNAEKSLKIGKTCFIYSDAKISK